MLLTIEYFRAWCLPIHCYKYSSTGKACLPGDVRGCGPFGGPCGVVTYIVPSTVTSGYKSSYRGLGTGTSTEHSSPGTVAYATPRCLEECSLTAINCSVVDVAVGSWVR